MESPVVVDKPPEYHGNTAKDDNRGFPFDEEEGSGAWSDLAARHPDIAARLRQRPATWARKRRPSSQDATDDFADGFGGFDRFPFEDIPPEFREHFPSHWNRRFTREEPQHPQHQEQQQRQPSPQQTQPQHQTTATQTEQAPGPSTQTQQPNLPQYGLRNTVDLGQKSPADPSLVDGEDRGQRSMSAPPDSSDQQKHANKMSGQNDQPPPQADQSANVRHIPIFVEGRDEPVINKNNHFGEAKQQYAPPPPQQPHVDREYFEEIPGFHHPPNFSRTFGTPFNKGFRGGTQPFAQQKMYPQTGFARGASPQRSQSPHMSQDEHFVKVPVHHDQPRSEPKPQQRPQAQQQPPQQPPHHEHPQQQHHQQQQQQQQQQHQQTPPQQQQAPPKPQPSANDPISVILGIQTDVLNLMTEVENFTGSKKDKKYIFLDEMLTRNLIKLDNIETDGKENIRQARKEAIKCIQKCIAVLEAKADKNTPQPTDVEMKENDTDKAEANGEVAMQPQQNEPQTEATVPEEAKEDGKEIKAEAVQAADEKEAALPQAADTRQDNEQTDKETRPDEAAVTKNEEKNDNVDKKATKKGKNVKKRDKSKDKKEANSNSDEKEAKTDAMQIDDKGDKAMEVDGATPSQ